MKLYKERYNFYLSLLFISYIIISCWLLFFQVGTTDRSSYFTSRQIHLIPFESTFHSIELAITNNFETQHKVHHRYLTARNLVGNILLFLPWGLLTPLVFATIQTLRKVLVSAIIISLCVEIVQFLLVIGVADVDDVILNTIGATIGFYLPRLKNQKSHCKQ